MWPLWVLVLSVLLTVLIVVGNGMVIYLILTKRNLRTTTNWFVLSLAVADFGVGSLHYPRLIICQLLQGCAIDKPVIIVTFCIGLFFGYASVTNLCALTLDRYLAIVKPLRYVTFMTKKRVVLLIVAAWVVAFLLLVPFSVAYFILQKYSKYILHGLAVCFFFLCITLSFVTARIFIVVRRIARQNAAVVAQLSFNHKIQHKMPTGVRESTSAKMIGTIVAIFVVCWLTDVVDVILGIWSSPLPRPAFHIILTFQRLINSAINPVAYAFFKQDFKRELTRMLCRKKSC